MPATARQCRPLHMVVLIVVLLLTLLPLAAPSAGARQQAASAPSAKAAQQASSDPAASTDRLIVKLRASGQPGALAAQAPDVITAQASALGGEELRYLHESNTDTHILALSGDQPIAAVEAIARRIAASPEVEYAEPDYRMFVDLTPTDPLYNTFNWHLQEVSGANYGANLPSAWDITTGSSNLVVAIVDTGALLGHEDLTGRNLAANPGYDVISDENYAQDGVDSGSERDPDPSDPGDWVPAGWTCTPRNSTWHGSHVAGTIGASANNAKGVTGINWVSKLLHVRALGRCGGTTSDIAAGMLWAAGESVPGLPVNPNPARVINMSLGGVGACPITYQNTINTLAAKGVVVVVAAGNSNANASGFTPANCSGVITVAATTWSGNKASYSNFGTSVEIAAPGGGQKNAGEAAKYVVSSISAGTQGPTTDAYGQYQGTSMAAPHVAGVVSLMLSVNPGLTNAQVLSILQSTVTPFPAGSTCLPLNNVCGPGILNAGAAVEEAARRVRTVAFASASQSASEAAGLITLPITLPNKSNKTVTVPYAVAGTANGADHTLVNGTLTYTPGNTSQNISFTITDDAAAESSETVVITLGTPTNAVAGGTSVHTLTILDNDGNPGVDLSTTAVSFGNQQIGTTSLASTVTLTNSGTTDLSISGIAVSGSDFDRDGGTCATVFPANLAAGASCTVLLTFSPATTGAKSGSLTFTTNAAGSPHTVDLSGIGSDIGAAPPDISLSATSLGFGDQQIGLMSDTRAITLTSSGTSNLTITNITVSGSDFARGGGTCATVFPAALASGASCTILLTFAPATPGAKSGSVTITTNAPGSPHTVDLSGTGSIMVYLPLITK